MDCFFRRSATQNYGKQKKALEEFNNTLMKGLSVKPRARLFPLLASSTLMTCCGLSMRRFTKLPVKKESTLRITSKIGSACR